ncbi:MAG: T9SS type A sorting domain-containing protein [Paludibacteraceae bacterium]|nr:T9SS type A sorting domain-containing protein [Paludibacteraceae bacterium]
MKKTLLTSLLVSAALFANAQMRNVELKCEITTLEPMKGIVLWPETMKDIPSLNSSVSLEFSYCLPSKVVTGCQSNGTINYDWTWFDNILADVASRGHQLIARFRYEYPSGTDAGGVKGSTAVPQYIKDRTDYHETYSSNPGGDGPTYYADWSNTELQRFTKQFYTDFAARYANDKRLAFLEVGFGHWSEYHIYGTALDLGHNFPSKAYQKEFFQHLSSVMTDIPWLISIDAADDKYTPFVDDDDLMGLKFGLFDDSFMHEGHDIGSSDGYNEENWNAIGKGTRWQTGVCGGEISYYTEDDQHNFLNPDGMYGKTWEQASAKYHMTFVIGNDAVEGSYATAARMKEAGNNAGYSFEITKYQVSSSSAVVTVKNNGIAPFYYDAYVTVKGTRSTTSLKGLLPGESIECTVTGLTISGSESPALTITSDHLLDGVTIPYKADLEGGSISTAANNSESASLIEQRGSKLLFGGENFEVEIFSVAAQRVASTKESTFDLSTLPAGVYTVRYVSERGTAVKKVVK